MEYVGRANHASNNQSNGADTLKSRLSRLKVSDGVERRGALPLCGMTCDGNTPGKHILGLIDIGYWPADCVAVPQAAATYKSMSILAAQTIFCFRKKTTNNATAVPMWYK